MTAKVAETIECYVHPAVSEKRISTSDCLPTKGSEAPNVMVSNWSSAVEVRCEFTSHDGDEISDAGKESFSFQNSEGGSGEIKTEELEIDAEPEDAVLVGEFSVPSTNVNGIEENDTKIQDGEKVKEEDPLGLPLECDNDWPKAAQTYDKEKHAQVRRDLPPTIVNSSTAFNDHPNISQSTATSEGTKNSIRVRKDLAESPAVSRPPVFYENPNIPQSTTVFQGTNQNYGFAFNAAASIPSNCFEIGLMNGNSISGINQQQIYYCNGIFFTLNTGIISSGIQSGALVVANNHVEKNVAVDSDISPHNLTNAKLPTRKPQSSHPLETNTCQISTKSDSCSTQQCRKLLPKIPANETRKMGPPIPTVPSFTNGPPILSVYANNCHLGVRPVPSANHSGEFQQEGPVISPDTENYLQLGTPAVLKNLPEGNLTFGSQGSTNEHTNSILSAKLHLHLKDRSHFKTNTSIRGFDFAAWQPRVLLHRSHLAECLAGALKCNKARTSCSRCPVSKVPTVKKKPESKRRPCSKRPLVSSSNQQEISSSSSLLSKKSSTIKDDRSFDIDEELFSGAGSFLPERYFTCMDCTATFKTKNSLRSHSNGCSAVKTALPESASYKAGQDLESSNICSTEKTVLLESASSKAEQDLESSNICSTDKTALLETASSKAEQDLKPFNVCPVEKTALFESASTKAEGDLKPANPPKLLYSCQECSAKFKTKFKLKTHLKVHMGKKYFCAFCSKKFKSKRKIMRHLQHNHSDKDLFFCGECPMTFASRYEQRKHSVVHVPFPRNATKLFSCAECAKEFKVKGTLRTHLIIHSTERPFSCPDCPKTFKDKFHLKSHSAVHSDKRLYLCEHCGMSFKSRTVVREHLRNHSDKRPHKCRQCGFAFKFQRDLKLHYLTHLYEKRFMCPHPECSYRYNIKQELTRHLRVHSEERPHLCGQCPARFKEKRHMMEHIAVKHLNRTFSCKCGIAFRTKWSLRKHEIQVHSDAEAEKHEAIQREKLYSCAECPDAKFWTKGSLKSHILYHSTERPFACGQCASAFKKNGDLRKHFSIHSNERLYKCAQCSSSFKKKDTLKAHMQVHSKEKPFACPLCPASFKRKRMVTIHMSVHSKEKPFLCAHCAKTFKSQLGLKYHVEHAHSKGTK